MGNLSKFRGGHGPLALHVAMLLHGKLDVGHALVPRCSNIKLVLDPIATIIQMHQAWIWFLVSQTYIPNISNESNDTVFMGELPCQEAKS